MLNVASYKMAYIVTIKDFDNEVSTPGWDLFAGDMAYLVKKSIEEGYVPGPGTYIVHVLIVDGREKLQFIDITDDIPSSERR